MSGEHEYSDYTLQNESEWIDEILSWFTFNALIFPAILMTVFTFKFSKKAIVRVLNTISQRRERYRIHESIYSSRV